MALTSYNDIIAAVSGGDCVTGLFHKTHVASGSGTAGRWYDLFLGTGTPNAGSYSGSAGIAAALNGSSTGAMYTGGNVSPDTKYISSGRAWTPTSAVIPATLWLVDYLLYYPSCVVTGSPTALDNTVTLPRYTTGAGVMGFAVVQTALGAASPSLTFTYTNSGGTGSRSTEAIVAAANSLPTPTLMGNKSFFPLQAGDLGIRKIDSYTINSGGTTGTVCLVLCKPLIQIPLYVVNNLVDRDFVTSQPTFPVIPDDSCLGFIISPGSSMANGSFINANLDFVWG